MYVPLRCKIYQRTNMEDKMYSYKYPHPSVTTDCVIFGFDGTKLQVLLVERGIDPYKGKWAFPGGFMNMDETTEQCARRELKEETGLEIGDVQQVGAYSTVDRDPRGRTITVAYITHIPQILPVTGLDDAAEAKWWPINTLPPLAFDHAQILQDALK